MSLKTLPVHTTGQLAARPAPDPGLTCSLWHVGECWPSTTQAWLTCEALMLSELGQEPLTAPTVHRSPCPTQQAP